MRAKGDETPLHHMLDAARKVLQFTEGRSRNELETDELLALAAVRLLEIIGEAAKRVPQPIKQAHSQIPWRAIAGARDRLIHGYFDVDYEVVWAIITDDLPSLVKELEQILNA